MKYKLWHIVRAIRFAYIPANKNCLLGLSTLHTKSVSECSNYNVIKPIQKSLMMCSSAQEYCTKFSIAVDYSRTFRNIPECFGLFHRMLMECSPIHSNIIHTEKSTMFQNISQLLRVFRECSTSELWIVLECYRLSSNFPPYSRILLTVLEYSGMHLKFQESGLLYSGKMTC